jgi:hypothetical protein
VESSHDPERKEGEEASPVTRPSLDRSTDPGELIPPSSLQVPVSVERRSTEPDPGKIAALRAPRVSGETTLLSAPAPADPREIEIDDRLNEHDRRLANIDERLEMVSRAHARLEKSAALQTRQAWLPWVIFLLALALLWHLGQWLR